MDDIEEIVRELGDIRRELKTIREQIGRAIFFVTNAEAEIPEKMRRFVAYMHDLHDISYVYEERGHMVPPWILREMERCDDRFRQLLKELHLEGSTFAKVRADMAQDPENRWDHSRYLEKPQHEARKSDNGGGAQD